MDFHWLIVDDGSTDETENLIKGFQNAAPFEITYLKQENGGKQRAHNTGVFNCSNELFVCVDSDDEIVDDAVESILSQWKRVKDNDNVSGIIALCGSNATTPLNSRMPPDTPYVTMWDLYWKLGHRGDTTLVHRTEILKQFPFVLAKNEKFMAETYVYHQIDQHYTMSVLDKVIIVREYLPDGYTHNVRKVTKQNPLDYITLKRMYIEYSDTFWLRFTNSILYLVGYILAKKKGGVKDAPYPWIAALAYPAAWMLTKTVYR